MIYTGLVFLLLTIMSCKKQKQDLSNLEETIYVKANGAEMPAYVRGNGASNVFVIVVHGGPGGNGYEYRAGEYAALLENEYAMVYWDQRGQGMATGNYRQKDNTIDQMTDDLRDLILVVKEHYGKDTEVFLMGHSWGGTLGTAFMVKQGYQDMVTGWIEADGAHDIPKLNIEAIKMFRSIGQEQIDLGHSVDKWKEIVDFANGVDTNDISISDGGSINSYGFEAEGLLQEVDSLYTGSGGALSGKSPINLFTSTIAGRITSAALMDEIESTSLTDQLYKITTPTLLLWGKYDFVVPPQLGIDAYNLIGTPNKELVMFNHSGHSPMDNEAKAYSNAMIDFIEQYRN
jgi:pimeloyl-ACP methyl ester carboxylesterase